MKSTSEDKSPKRSQLYLIMSSEGGVMGYKQCEIVKKEEDQLQDLGIKSMKLKLAIKKQIRKYLRLIEDIDEIKTTREVREVYGDYRHHLYKWSLDYAEEPYKLINGDVTLLQLFEISEANNYAELKQRRATCPTKQTS